MSFGVIFIALEKFDTVLSLLLKSWVIFDFFFFRHKIRLEDGVLGIPGNQKSIPTENQKVCVFQNGDVKELSKTPLARNLSRNEKLWILLDEDIGISLLLMNRNREQAKEKAENAVVADMKIRLEPNHGLVKILSEREKLSAKDTVQLVEDRLYSLLASQNLTPASLLSLDPEKREQLRHRLCGLLMENGIYCTEMNAFHAAEGVDFNSLISPEVSEKEESELVERIEDIKTGADWKMFAELLHRLGLPETPETRYRIREIGRELVQQKKNSEECVSAIRKMAQKAAKEYRIQPVIREKTSEMNGTGTAGENRIGMSGMMEAETVGMNRIGMSGMMEAETAGMNRSRTPGMMEAGTAGMNRSRTPGMMEAGTAGMNRSRMSGMMGTRMSGITESGTPEKNGIGSRTAEKFPETAFPSSPKKDAVQDKHAIHTPIHAKSRRPVKGLFMNSEHYEKELQAFFKELIRTLHSKIEVYQKELVNTDITSANNLRKMKNQMELLLETMEQSPMMRKKHSSEAQTEKLLQAVSAAEKLEAYLNSQEIPRQEKISEMQNCMTEIRNCITYSE